MDTPVILGHCIGSLLKRKVAALPIDNLDPTYHWFIHRNKAHCYSMLPQKGEDIEGLSRREFVRLSGVLCAHEVLDHSRLKRDAYVPLLKLREGINR